MASSYVNIGNEDSAIYYLKKHEITPLNGHPEEKIYEDSVFFSLHDLPAFTCLLPPQITDSLDRVTNWLIDINFMAYELKKKGRADARKFDIATILFTDFKEFTQISENLSAEDLVSEINTCFKRFDTICTKYGIEKIKTIGDSYMASGGLPVPSDDSVKSTVLAGLEMTEFMIKRKQDREVEGDISFEMLVGIHTGSVVAGIVGVTKFQYDIWGDTVNTASRMESSGEVGKVNISRYTYELLKDDPIFNFQSRGKVITKGKGDVEMWFVEKAS